MKWTTGIKIFFALCLVGLAGYAYHFFTDQSVKADAYENVPDLSAAYRADKEIKDALTRLNDAQLTPATVVTHNVDGKRQIALTFDGLPRKQTLDRLLGVLEKHRAVATFFAEGGNAALSPESVQALEAKGQAVGNYTFIGMARLEQQPTEVAVEQLCRTQKVLQLHNNFSARFFKAPQTRNTLELLKVAAACGLESGVRSDVYLPKEQLVSVEAAKSFVATIPAGSVVSVVVSRPVDVPRQREQQSEERPAIDKKPSLVLQGKPEVRHESIVDVTERFLTACEEQGLEIVPLARMRTVRLAQPVAAVSVWERGALLLRDALARPLAWERVASAAPSYESERLQNAGRLAEERKFILTTEPALAFCFVGWSKPVAVTAVLDRLRKLGAQATFFVSANDIRNNEALVRRAQNEGHELAIAVYAKRSGSFASVCNDIATTRALLRERFGVDSSLVKQPWGAIEDYTKEAVAAMGCTLITQNVNVVQTRHRDYGSANEILPELFGKYVYSLGRGWIVNFRMDYYTKPLLCADVMQLLKEKKIDNIAYWSFEDDPEHNPANDSAYAIKSVGALLHNKRYTYSLSAEKVPQELRPEYNAVAELPLKQYIRERYLGNGTVNIDSNALGFTQEELRHLDVSGRVHTNRPVVFFTFDDWGTDAPINQLLYVLRKHGVKATFFVLARNVKNNPNLLRAIAAEGHDIACHTYNHKPMASTKAHNRLYSLQSEEEKLQDYRDAYAELARITGDVRFGGKYSLTRIFRPPTLTISKEGFRLLQQAGYEYIVSGSTSTHDYQADNLYEMIDNIRDGLYERGAVKKGAVFVMHMSDSSRFTARALDILMTQNEEKHPGDPTRFVAGRLSDYLVSGYAQARRSDTLSLQYGLGQ